MLSYENTDVKDKIILKLHLHFQIFPGRRLAPIANLETAQVCLHPGAHKQVSEVEGLRGGKQVSEVEGLRGGMAAPVATTRLIEWSVSTTDGVISFRDLCGCY